MSTFHDPLRRYPQIDESNFLEPKIENFLNMAAPEAFYESIRRLIPIRDTLRIARDIGRLNEITYQDFYMNALQWLNKQIAISNYVSIPQITDYSQIDEGIASNLNSYTSYLHNNITGQVLFSQIQVMQGVIQNKIVEDISNRVVTPIEEEFVNHLATSKNDVTESMDRTKNENETQLTKQFNDQIESIRIAKENAIAEFEQARALANWSSFYAEKTRSYKLAVYGRSWPHKAIERKFRSFRGYRKSLSVGARARTSLQFFPGLVKCIALGTAILYSKANSYSGKRTFWFTCLGLAVLGTIMVNLASIYEFTILGLDLAKLKPTHNDTQLFAKIFIYLGLFLIPTLGYSFANKNYRIYSNLLEQYAHREVVAQTIQGILAKPRGDEDDEAVRKELANVASTALFEQKTIGHLSKNEANSASILDIARLFRN